MNIYRATVYYLSAASECVEGDAGITRRVVEQVAESEGMFKAQVMDDYTRNVDDLVEFGPVTNKGRAE